MESYGIPIFFMLNLFLPFFLLLCMKHYTWSDLTIFSLIGRSSPEISQFFSLGLEEPPDWGRVSESGFYTLLIN